MILNYMSKNKLKDYRVTGDLGEWYVNINLMEQGIFVFEPTIKNFPMWDFLCVDEKDEYSHIYRVSVKSSATILHGKYITIDIAGSGRSYSSRVRKTINGHEFDVLSICLFKNIFFNNVTVIHIPITKLLGTKTLRINKYKNIIVNKENIGNVDDFLNFPEFSYRKYNFRDTDKQIYDEFIE